MSEDEVQATDAAVEKAEELGVDLSTVEPTGASGQIIVSDVVAADAELADAEAGEETTTTDAGGENASSIPGYLENLENVAGKEGGPHESSPPRRGAADEALYGEVGQVPSIDNVPLVEDEEVEATEEPEAVEEDE